MIHFFVRSSLVPILCFLHVNAQLHFASLGNWGTGDSAATAVAGTLKSKARETPLTFIVSPGSNFPGGGVLRVNETKWQTAFVDPFSGPELNVPFFSVLGSEDWKGEPLAQIERTNYTGLLDEGTSVKLEPYPKWTLPNWWYHYSMHFSDSSSANAAFGSSDVSIHLVFIDTEILSDEFFAPNISQVAWQALRETVSTAVQIYDWVVVVGDKAMLSSGSSKGDSYLSETLRRFLKDMQVDAYISGNDRDMEVIEDGSLLHINSGAGSGGDLLPRVKASNSAAYSGRPGFCLHTVSRKTFRTDFVDGYTGQVIKSFEKPRNVRSRSFLDRFHLYRQLPQVAFLPMPKFLVGGMQGDLFVPICGTIGLVLGSFLTLSYAGIMTKRFSKRMQGGSGSQGPRRQVQATHIAGSRPDRSRD